MNSMKNHLSKIACLLFVVLSISSAVSAQINYETLKQIEKIMEKYKPANPGCQLSISQNGKVVFSKAYGMADLEHNVPLTLESPIVAGSVAKQFTAAAILLLEQQGKLSLQDDIRKYLPEMPDYGVQITLDQMMRHTSGLRDWDSITLLSGWRRSTKLYNNKDVLAMMTRQKGINFKPGERSSYSNSNYNLLAIIAERVSGMSLPEFTKKYIFEPAGMTHTHWRNYFKVVLNRAIGYSKRENTYYTEPPNEHAYGDGGLVTTTEDLLKWNAFYLSGKFGSPSLLDKQITTVPYNNGKPGNYAAGLEISLIRGWKAIYHAGHSWGYRAYLEHFPELDLSIAWLSNTGEFDGSPPIWRDVRNLLVTRKTATPPPAQPEIKPITLSAEQLKKYEGWYREDSWNGGSAIKLTARDGKLAISAGGMLTPVGENTFMLGASIKVQYFEAGKKMVFDFPNETLTLIAAENPVINEKTLSEYSGVYYSDETESKMTFKTKDGKLFLSVRPQEEFELSPEYKDRFKNPVTEGGIQFIRDKKKQIVGIELSDARSVGIKFEKIVKKK